MRDVNAWAAVAVGATVFLAACGRDGYPDQPLLSMLTFLEQALLFSLAAAGAVVDARSRIIPNAVCGGIVVLHTAFLFATAAAGVGAVLLGLAFAIGGGFALGGGLLAFTLAYEMFTGGPQALGGGDIKLVFALGFALGLGRGLLILVLACATFTLYAAVLAMRAHLRKAAPARFHPFAPALATGTFLVLLAC